ncbi:MAG: 3-hydroxyacyl-CoA dehydrogenase/enoyl-CoA hydratase family protein [Rudaea sp.]|uniref:3-hydroxyacyl-CoA dehydrogenase/enoyl-CoA hydratase family protein n=1 Tax=Rudaea sp. TaxID=2136325 RepID=UPI0039E550D0
MDNFPLRIRQVAVLGAGVMGAQIAAHLVNAGVDTLLFDLPAKDGNPNGVVLKAIENLKKISPAPLADASRAGAIVPANYDQHLALLRGCDLIIEAIAEKLDWKRDLYAKIAPFVSENAILASNTSGLSINSLADVLSAHLHERFCGVHFFNPPRYMHLAELIPCAKTMPEVLAGLETFLTTTLGKGVVYAKDTPNFIGNRIGVFSILSTIHHTEQFKLSYDVVDALTGPAIGHPKSATYRTADVVGLDTMGHVIQTMEDTLPNDPWHGYFGMPPVLAALVAKGALGQKSGAGFFRKVGKDILVLDPAKGDYVAQTGQVSDEVAAILKIKNPAEQFAKLRASSDPQAQFLWAVHRDLFHYAAYHLAAIADSARDVDFAMRWGYGWKLGPFETWQAAGWAQVAQWISEDIAAGKTMSNVPLPAWALDPSRIGVHQPDGSSWSAAQNTVLPRSNAPVYARQLFPQTTIGAQVDRGTTVFETDEARLWTLGGDDIAILSFKTKMHTLGAGVIDAVHRAIDEAERNFQGLVIWQDAEPFSAGADLAGAGALLQAGKVAEFEAFVNRFQQTSLRIKHALVPVVAAVRGMALGGGCEFQMHCARTVAALESYIGLVEAGVGLLPAGGGLKELALRASARAIEGDVFTQLKSTFQTVAMAKVSGSALEAKELGLLRQSDVVVFHAEELLYVAKNEARALYESGYRPPLYDRQITVAGDVGTATFKASLVNLLEGRFLSEHDFDIASRIADTLCGGPIERGSPVDEQWLLDLERRHFVALAQTPKTQERIVHTLKTGKPLRN